MYCIILRDKTKDRYPSSSPSPTHKLIQGHLLFQLTLEPTLVRCAVEWKENTQTLMTLINNESRSDGVGLIIPPLEVREFLEKTATFIAKKPSLEVLVLERHRDDPRFTFLHGSDPYHSYYRQRVSEIRANAADDKTSTPNKSTSTESNAAQQLRKRPEPTAEQGTQQQHNPQASISTNDKLISSNPNTGPVHPSENAQSEASCAPTLNLTNTDKHTPASGQAALQTPSANGKTTSTSAQISFMKSARAKAEAQRRKRQEQREREIVRANSTNGVKSTSEEHSHGQMGPREDVFTLPDVSPRSSALSVDVMKLTARFAAQYGTDFVRGVARREGRNPTFDFLKPLHPHSVIFQRLVDAYTQIVNPTKRAGLIRELSTLTENREALVDRVWAVHDWECQKAEREHEAALDEREKIRRAQIDWHDFVVVATVDFDEDDDDDEDDDAAVNDSSDKMNNNGTRVKPRNRSKNKSLPAPVADVRLLLEMLAAARKEMAEREKNRRDIDMDVDNDRATTANAQNPGVALPKDAKVQLANIDSDIPVDRIRTDVEPSNKMTTIAGVDGRTEGGAKTTAGITTNASQGTTTGRVGATEGNNRTEATVVLPSGQRVPLSKAEESMRAELLDPSYKTERARAADKSRVRNLAGGDEVARNLARWDLAQQEDGGVYNRGDLQEALLERRATKWSGASAQQALAARVDQKMGRATEAGPQRESEGRTSESGGKRANGAAGEEGERELKKARVDRAVDLLAKGRRVREEVDEEKAVQAVEAEVVGSALGAGGGKSVGEVGAPAAVAADEWLARHGGASAKVKIVVQVCKHDNDEWALHGQPITMAAPLRSSVGRLKQALQRFTKLPAKKQKVHMDGPGFLKDDMTLAAYNVGDGAVLGLEVKERGGRKKQH